MAFETSWPGQFLEHGSSALMNLGAGFGGCCGRPSPKPANGDGQRPSVLLPGEDNIVVNADASGAPNTSATGAPELQYVTATAIPELRPSSNTGRNASKRQFICGYCGTVKTSKSADTEGRVRIRCECGGVHQDGKTR